MNIKVLTNKRLSPTLAGMKCDSCGNAEAHRLSYSVGKTSCDKCGGKSNFQFSDVYFKEPYFDPMIAHPDHSPLGTQIKSREHKAFVMRELGMSERGDKRHGAR